MSTYSELHTAIVSGALSPGERLVEEELAERLGASRGAVREAILRLAHDGLVVRERNRGARVRRFTLEEAVEILEARAALESLAAGYAALRRTDDEARELETLVERDAAPARRGRAAGHVGAQRGAAPPDPRDLRPSVSRDICARLHSQMVRFQFRTVLAPGRSERSLAEHQRIVEAIAAGDRAAAEAAMRAHLTNVGAALTEIAVAV